ncbi:MAG: pilin [Patescibacteria group bacterium]
MKKNIIKFTYVGFLIASFIFSVIYTLSLTNSSQVFAEDADTSFNSSCTVTEDLDITVQFPDSRKLFAGQTVAYEIKQPEDTEYKTGAVLGKKSNGSNADPLGTNQVIYNYRIYLWNGQDDPQSGSVYKLIADGVIRPEEDRVGEFTIPKPINAGDYGSAGNYDLRFVIDDKVRNCSNFQIEDYNFDIAETEGIVITPDTNNVKKGDTASIKVKFFDLEGQTYKVYIDQNTDDHLKGSGTVPDDNVPVTVEWDTGGTDTGSHTIIVEVYPGVLGTNNNHTEYKVTVAEVATNDSDAKAVSVSGLNNFNIKNLLNTCSSKKDLDQILCMVTTLISWLLDISAVVAFIMILYASIIYLTSYGEESKAELAKKTLLWSVIGVIVIGVAIGIMKIIESIFQ